MAEQTLVITGTGLVDKETHYEAHPYIGPEQVTLKIRGDIADDFQNAYGIPITKAEYMTVTVDLDRNDNKLPECRDSFKQGSHLTGYVRSLSDIFYQKE
jgi:hypothetical protein